jgi:hypothetical protein
MAENNMKFDIKVEFLVTGKWLPKPCLMATYSNFDENVTALLKEEWEDKGFRVTITESNGE